MKSAAPFDGVDDTAMSIFEWFASNISGRAAFELENGGFRCRISRPLAFTSVGSATNTGRIPPLRDIFTGDPGSFCVRIGLMEKTREESAKRLMDRNLSV